VVIGYPGMNHLLDPMTNVHAGFLFRKSGVRIRDIATTAPARFTAQIDGIANQNSCGAVIAIRRHVELNE
jgi:hypothetical protein